MPLMAAVEAFEVMCRHAVSGVGVTDGGGDALIANLVGPGPGKYCPPRHLPRSEPSLAALNAFYDIDRHVIVIDTHSEP
jgi:hypothetical protein